MHQDSRRGKGQAEEIYEEATDRNYYKLTPHSKPR